MLASGSCRPGGLLIDIRQAIGDFRNALLAHHLGVEPERVNQALVEQGSLLAALDSLRGGARTLKEFPWLRMQSDPAVTLDFL